MKYLMIKRFLTLITLLIGVFFIPAYFFLVRAQAAASSAESAAIAQVVWVKGSINASITKEEKPRLLKRGDPIFAHDTLTTDKVSSGQIVFSDSSLLSLKEDTVFRIDEYKFNQGKDPSQEKYVASLVKGGLRTITGAISKGHPENYKLVTPVATIGVRGTELRVNWTAASGLEVGVYKGEIVVKNDIGQTTLNSSNPYVIVHKATEALRPTTTPPPALKQQLPLQTVKPPANLVTALPAATNTTPGKPTVAPTGTTGGGGATGEGVKSVAPGKPNPSSGDFKICN